MRITRSVVTAGLGVLLADAPTSAHHSFAAEFNVDQPVKLQGTVTQMEWINPHAWIHIEVKGPDGKVETWDIESAAPNALLRRGWTKKSLPAGTQIVVVGYLAKDGTNTVNGREITFSDGRKMFVGSSGTGAPDEGREQPK